MALPNDPRGGNSSGGFGIGGGGGGGLNLIKLPRAAKDDDGDTVGKLTTQGPIAIHGVYLDYQGESLRKFFGKDKYEEWTFTAELITAPVTAPGRPLPRISDDWLGKSFPDGLTPMVGSGSGPTAPGKPGTELGGAGKPGQPGSAPSANDQKGAPEEPPAEPDTPAEFPEDFPSDQPEDVPDDTMQEEPRDFDPPPDEDIPPPEDDVNPDGGRAR